MNSRILKTWIEEQLIPNLPEDSVVVIIMDNASNHSTLIEGSKAPTSGSRKDEMKKWLNGREFDPQHKKESCMKFRSLVKKIF